MGIFNNSLFKSVKNAFDKTKTSISEKLNVIFSNRNIEAEDLEEIENILLQSDFGIDFTENLVGQLKKKIKSGEQVDISSLKNTIQDVFISEYNSAFKETVAGITKPHFIVLLGINGSGKTTTIAKLANYYSKQDKRVIIGSCDTFRAAANEQLSIWASRTNVKIIEDFSKDPAAVAYETGKLALESNFDVVLIDTAGRLHTNKNLLDELRKILNVIEKIGQNCSLDILLVVDGNSGQNAKTQLVEFSKVVAITGLIITKLDGTAKGGSVLQLCLMNKVPVKFIGIGEHMEDFAVFDPKEYIISIFSD
ncbi:MAG: fused signal recognition particle [Ignavibacteria bacterium]|nr:MAG: fused signal recognition particle [Ignavibacteria bacterium]